MELMATLKSLISFFFVFFESATQFRLGMGDGCVCVCLSKVCRYFVFTDTYDF